MNRKQFKVSKYFITTQKDFDITKTTNFIILKCSICNKEYSKTKKNVLQHNERQDYSNLFCSQKCSGKFRTSINNDLVHCKNCNKNIYKTKYEIKSSKNVFCNTSCSATYNNKRKTTGIRRSKLEIYLEEQLSILKPELLILYSDKSAIESELDIYIPSLKLAIEIQGIFHYKPIFGDLKLKQIQDNDLNKKLICFEKNIKLICINVSDQKKFTINSSQKYLNYILDLIKV